MLRGRPIKYEGMALVSTVGSIVVGGETLVSDLTRTYIRFKLLHSFPTINGNGMTFTPQNIALSIGTAVNQPLDFNHQLEGNPHDGDGNPIDGEGKILGSMIRTQTDAKSDSPLIPESPFTAEVIGVLWNRTESARKVIESLGTEEKEYKVSMEAIRNSENDGWYVKRDGEWHYVSSISAEEFEKWEAKKYDEVGLAVGGTGEDGTTNFWGGAFTLTPADGNATIDDVLIASFDNCAIAALNSSTNGGVDKPKENKMNLKFKEMIAAIAAGFKAAVSGNDLKLTVGETEYVNPDFYMSGYENGDGTYSVYASLTTKVSSDDGMEETKRFEYDGTPDNEDMVQVEASEAKVKMPLELIAAIVNLEDEKKSIAAKYTDYVSKADADKMVTEAVAAALLKAKDGGDDMDGDKITKEQASALAKEEVDKAMATRDKEDATEASRCEQIEAGGFTLTDERKEVIASMPATDEGDKVFKSYLDSLVAGRTEMKKDFKDSGIDVGDKGVQAALAAIDNTKSSGFLAVKAALSGSGGAFSPTLTPEAASQNTQSFV